MSDELVKQQSHKAARLVPDHIWKLTQHYHDLLELKKHWESNGVPSPPHFLKELERADKAMAEALEEEWGQGGQYRKAEDERNKGR